MSTITPFTANQIADKIDWYKMAYVAASMVPVMLNHPAIVEPLRGIMSGGTLAFGRRDNTYHEVSFDAVLDHGTNSNQFNLEMLGGYLNTAISVLGNDLSKQDYFDRNSLLEFFRHIRNGLSHGNQFHFTSSEPRRPAQFGIFTIDRTLQGRNILFQYMSAGDVLDLFDAVAEHLRQLPPKDPQCHLTRRIMFTLTTEKDRISTEKKQTALFPSDKDKWQKNCPNIRKTCVGHRSGRRHLRLLFPVGTPK